MIKVIRKLNIEELMNPTPSTISVDVIPSIETEESIVLLESIKPSIKITYNSQGEPDIQIANLGTQFDHRVTFLEFDLEQLTWNLLKENNEKYNYYNFYLGVTDETGETSIWEFDGKHFEIPRKITRYAGLYTFTLIIEEYRGDNIVGNIKQETSYYTERFIAKPFKGNVSPTGYRPEYNIVLFDIETDQLAALTKSSIECSLTDDGVLTLDNTILGEKLDNFVTYFKFSPGRITAHLDKFTLLMTFKQQDRFCCAMFEHVNATDSNDITTHPLIAWIPSEVYQNPGNWIISVIGFMGNMKDINNPNEYNGDYYFYISKEVTVTVVDNVLKQSDLNKEAILSVSSLGLLTANNEAIITKQGDFYTTSITGGNEDD